MSYFTRRKQYAVTQVAKAEQAQGTEDVQKDWAAANAARMSGGSHGAVNRQTGKVDYVGSKGGRDKWLKDNGHTAGHNSGSHMRVMGGPGMKTGDSWSSKVGKAEEDREPILKDDSAPMQQTTAANQASGEAYQATSPPQQAAPAEPPPPPTPPAPVNEQIQKHKAAAALHGAAAKAHRTAGKAAMEATPTVGAAHYQQAQAHDNAQQGHANYAQNLQDAKDQGYR